MNKPMLGLVLGGVLGIVDGLTALAEPEVASQMVGIVIGSTLKGLVVGILVGWFSHKVSSLTWGLIVGLAAGAFFAALIALPQPQYFWQIVLPGSVVGLIVGFATQRFGRPAATQSRARA
jgi:uncharacterized membrane protein HdeD (DUF308 family)